MTPLLTTSNVESIKLDIGCGLHKRHGFIGVDLYAQSGVDLVVNLDKESLPYKDGSVDEIYSSHFLEHVIDPLATLTELTRVLKENGLMSIIVPHYSNPYAYHFTHKSFWSSYSLEQNYLDYYLSGHLVLLSKKVRIVNIWPFDMLFTSLANKSLSIYERFFSSFIKAWEVEFVLQKKFSGLSHISKELH